MFKVQFIEISSHPRLVFRVIIDDFLSLNPNAEISKYNT